MRTVKVKICGITREEDLEVACGLGADMVGFVLEISSSPRNLRLKKAKCLFNLVPENVKSVLVTVPNNLKQVLEAYNLLKPDIIQLHGENFLDLRLLKEKLPRAALIKVVHVAGEEAIEKAAYEASFFDGILVDSYAPGKHGGTGLVHDWSISKRVRDAIYPKPLILAGGLNPTNVLRAVETVKPYAVDVSTGVESNPGFKDPAKVEAFIRRAKQALLDDDYYNLGL
jgi:phosphoribosylanthranilate isomerase